MKQRIWLTHPFLIALVPIVSIFLTNYSEASSGVLLALCAFALAMTAAVFGIARLILKDAYRAAALTALFNVLFFAYGRVFQLVAPQKAILLSYRTWHLILLSTCAVILLATLAALRRWKWNCQGPSRFLTVASGMLLATMLVRIGLLAATSPPHTAPPHVAETTPRTAPLDHDSAETPDIYYIIPDAYCRADVLQNLFSHDNTEFLDYLRGRGFFIADQSCSNYPYTFISLPSSLNMRYLDEEVAAQQSATKRPWASFMADHGSLHDFENLTANSRVARTLQAKGYRYVHFRTNYWVTQQSDSADLQVGYHPAIVQNEFAQVVLRTTALCMFEPSMADMHLHAFEALKKIPKIEGPTFTLAHIICPHAPYVFDREGNVRDNVQQAMVTNRTKQDDRNEYRDQLLYTNRRLREVIDSILEQSKTPPVIIIQADHGFDSLVGGTHDTPPADWDLYARERLPILNAYLVPEAMRQKLYPTISPVNSFRLLLSECFGEELPMLPDRSYIGWYDAPFELRDATDVVAREGAPPPNAPQIIDELMARRYEASLKR